MNYGLVCRSAKLLSVLLLANFSLASVPAWEFQDTGFDTNLLPNSGVVGTALTMRDGFAWPVIHAPDRDTNQLLRSYSLFAAENPATQTNWFELGPPSFLGFANQGPPRLRGVSNAAGDYAVTQQDFDPGASGSSANVTLLGDSSSGGLGTILQGVGAFDFSLSGGSLTPQNTSPPGVSSGTIVDIAASPSGEVSVVTKQSRFSDEFTIWIDNPLIGWQSTEFSTGDGDPFARLDPQSLDLEYDSSQRPTPHVIGIDENSQSMVAFDFDPRTAQWQIQVLDQAAGSADLSPVALADNGSGVLGAAWFNDGELMYAYRDTNVISPSWAVTTVRALDNPPSPLASQTVGLAFDFNGLPLISFAELDDNTGDFNVMLAYDPPVTIEPGSDFNGDGLVTAADYAALRAGADPGFSDEAYDAWRADFGSGVAAANLGATTPEPTGLFLLLTAVTAVVATRRAGLVE